MPVIESAGSLLRDAPRRAAMTQAQLAERAGITQSVVSAYESGRRQPSLPVLLRLIVATGHCVEGQLVGRDDAERAPLSGLLGQRVRRHRTKIKGIAATYGASNVRSSAVSPEGPGEPVATSTSCSTFPQARACSPLSACAVTSRTCCMLASMSSPQPG